MQKKSICLQMIIGILFIIAGIYIMKIWEAPSATGLFSWKKSAVLEKETFFEDVEKLGITEVYQQISSSFEMEEIEAFLAKAAEKEVAVYFLTGEPEWALQKDADSIKQVVDRVVRINSVLQEHERIHGMMVDVEPYVLDEWEQDADKVMDIFVETMKSAYAYATENNIKITLCIPYFYDNTLLRRNL